MGIYLFIQYNFIFWNVNTKKMFKFKRVSFFCALTLVADCLGDRMMRACIYLSIYLLFNIVLNMQIRIVFVWHLAAVVCLKVWIRLICSFEIIAKYLPEHWTRQYRERKTERERKREQENFECQVQCILAVQWVRWSITALKFK